MNIFLSNVSALLSLKIKTTSYKTKCVGLQRSSRNTYEHGSNTD